MFFYLQMIDTPEDKSKFETVYLEYRDVMYRVAFHILNNEQDAEDAVHHAFMKIAENIEKISKPVCPKTRSYVVTIVENRAIDMYRRKKNHPAVPYDDETVGIQVEYTGTNELARCLAGLPARQRQVLLLKFYHGYSSREIAKMLGLSLSNAIKLEQRGKAKLEQLCEEAQII